MSRYLCLYHGPATPMADFTPEQADESTRAWGEWIGRSGPSLVDIGTPFGQRTAVKENGATVAPSEQNGYSIVEADSLEAALALLKGHPYLAGGKSTLRIEVFELVPM